MAEVQGRVRGERVEVAPAAVVVHPRALGARDRDRQRVVVVRRVALGDRGAVLGDDASAVDAPRRASPSRTSSASVRQRGPPPALRNSETSTTTGSKSRARSSRSRRGVQAGMTTVRPMTTEFAQNAAASSSVSAIASGTSAAIARAPLSSSAPGAYSARGRVERAEDDVDVVEARVAQLDRQDRPVDDPREVDVRRHRRARAVTGDERVAERQRVARALLRDVLAEAADRRSRARANQRSACGVSGRRSAWRIRAGTNVSPSTMPRFAVKTRSGRSGCGSSTSICAPGRAVRRDERVPLALRALAVDADREVHPRVDRVADVEVRRRAHEVAPPPAKV